MFLIRITLLKSILLHDLAPTPRAGIPSRHDLFHVQCSIIAQHILPTYLARMTRRSLEIDTLPLYLDFAIYIFQNPPHQGLHLSLNSSSIYSSIQHAGSDYAGIVFALHILT
jgi:hypothetical protein